jgi:hypothetical protein
VVDPFHPGALRGLGTALLHEGVPEAGQLFEEMATYLESGKLPSQPLGPRPSRRPLAPDELLTLMPRAHTPQMRAVAEMMRMLEPFSAAVLLEATGRIPRGDELPEANAVALRCRAVAQSLGVPPLRVFLEARDTPDARLVADAQLAVCIGKDLVRSSSLGLLVYEVARQLSFVSVHATFAAFAGPTELLAIVQAIVLEEGSDYIKDLRRRVLKPIPRRVRKDCERLAAEQISDLARDVVAWHTEEQLWADRVGLLLSRDTVAVLRAIAGEDPQAVRHQPRAAELVRWLASEGCWRAYLRFAT